MSPLRDSPQLPKSAEGDPVFPEPWAAEAFAMTVHLHQRGLFTWSEWAQTLSAELHQPGRAIDGSDYFDCWVAALSQILASKGVASAARCQLRCSDRIVSPSATPHGRPIELANDPLR